MEAAAGLQPSAPIFAALGRIHADLGKLPEAEAFLDRAEQVDPRWEMTYIYRGLVHQTRHEWTAAAAEFRRALALNPANSTARELLNGVLTRISFAAESTIEEDAEHR